MSSEIRWGFAGVSLGFRWVRWGSLGFAGVRSGFAGGRWGFAGVRWVSLGFRWGRSPQYFLKSPPESQLKTPRFHCPALACFIPWIFTPSHVVWNSSGPMDAPGTLWEPTLQKQGFMVQPWPVPCLRCL